MGVRLHTTSLGVVRSSLPLCRGSRQASDEVEMDKGAAQRAGRRDGPAKGTARETVITVDIYYDIICPFSYTIKHTLEGLVERYERAHEGVRVDLLWRPHCVIPPLERRVDKSQFYQHFERRAPGTLAILDELGPKHGIRFSLTGSMGSSRAAHRLVQMALRRLGPARQADALEALYRGHFVEGRDISDPGWLLAVGVAAGLRRGAVRSMLRELGMLEPGGGGGGGSRSKDKEKEGKEDEEEEEEDDDDEEEDGEDGEDRYSVEVPPGVEIKAVPCVIIQRRYKVGGLQEAELFEGVFEKVRTASAP
ncbi:hypothetical protein ESCO_006502 [Escovopsis weberi]|uniref:DSBA-like thioredoxin domain-containing protein n=1 Tax=Escovopsis weberi TaxID=150374 RepID=A0A0M8MYZ7_ESCWE|nr:hypothetical protein ESCO_006502 [Escovopsis weberi]